MKGRRPPARGTASAAVVGPAARTRRASPAAQPTVLVDGYNLLHALPQLGPMLRTSLEHAREQLINLLSEYQAASGSRVMVVFDGRTRPGGAHSRSPAGSSRSGAEVVFTAPGVSADQTIERFIRDSGDRQLLGVVTSDRLERSMVQGMGVACWSSEEFARLLTESRGETSATNRQLTWLAEAARRVEEQIPPAVREQLERLRRGETES